jgi:hypothetical protein
MRMDSKILESGSCKASRISSERIVNVFGSPADKSRTLYFHCQLLLQREG